MMTIDEKQAFIENLCDHVRDTSIEQLHSTPEGWGVPELAGWIADGFALNAQIARNPRLKKRVYEGVTRD